MKENQNKLTPDGHEAGEEDGAGVVKEIGKAGVGTTRLEFPVRTAPVTQRAHGEVTRTARVADLITGNREDETLWAQ